MSRETERPSGYLFGYPLAHSLSPILHHTIFQQKGLTWAYDVLESKDVQHFLQLLKAPKCYGSAVTMPHKISIIEHLDDLTEEGREVGACNTVFFRHRSGKRCLVGTNTDVIGIQEAFQRNVQNPGKIYHGRPALVVGGGGAARSAIYALSKWMRCPMIYMVNRDHAEVQAVIEACRTHDSKVMYLETTRNAEAIPAVGAIIGCIPDHPPESVDEKRVRAIVKVVLDKSHKGAMLEMAYHPQPWTDLARLAQAAGWQVILGTEAMIWQGLAQARLWTGQDLDDSVVDEVKRVIATELLET